MRQILKMRRRLQPRSPLVADVAGVLSLFVLLVAGLHLPL